VERGPPQGHIVAEQPPAQLVEQLDPAVDVRNVDQQPMRDPTARNRRTEPSVGAFDAEELFAAGSRDGRDGLDG
jgi:hypothetical protein